MTQDSVDNYNDSLSAAIIEKGKVNKLLKRNPTVEQVKEALLMHNKSYKIYKMLELHLFQTKLNFKKLKID